MRFEPRLGRTEGKTPKPGGSRRPRHEIRRESAGQDSRAELAHQDGRRLPETGQCASEHTGRSTLTQRVRCRGCLPAALRRQRADACAPAHFSMRAPLRGSGLALLRTVLRVRFLLVTVLLLVTRLARRWRGPFFARTLTRRGLGLRRLNSRNSLRRLLRTQRWRSDIRCYRHLGLWRWRHCCGLWTLASLAGLFGFCTLLRRLSRWCGSSNLWSRRRLDLSATLRRWQRCDRLCWLTALARLFGLCFCGDCTAGGGAATFGSVTVGATCGAGFDFPRCSGGCAMGAGRAACDGALACVVGARGASAITGAAGALRSSIFPVHQPVQQRLSPAASAGSVAPLSSARPP